MYFVAEKFMEVSSLIFLRLLDQKDCYINFLQQPLAWNPLQMHKSFEFVEGIFFKCFFLHGSISLIVRTPCQKCVS
jgi:hypothetical protein